MAMYRVSTGRLICWSISSFDLCKDIDYACNGFRKSQDGRWLESKWAPTLQQLTWKKEKKLGLIFNPIFLDIILTSVLGSRLLHSSQVCPSKYVWKKTAQEKHRFVCLVWFIFCSLAYQLLEEIFWYRAATDTWIFEVWVYLVFLKPIFCWNSQNQ